MFKLLRIALMYAPFIPFKSIVGIDCQYRLGNELVEVIEENFLVMTDLDST